MTELRFQRLESASDRRGDSYHIPQSVFEFMGGIEEMHFVTIEPGCVRGNHYHRGRKETMFVYYDGDWVLAWRRPGAKDISVQEFSDRGGVIVEIAPEIVHAVKNKGVNTIHLLSCSDASYTPSDTERVVILE
jgi:dTDP-4-dehydrorhamnose 3,5-epimerase-like enzyme